MKAKTVMSCVKSIADLLFQRKKNSQDEAPIYSAVL